MGNVCCRCIRIIPDDEPRRQVATAAGAYLTVCSSCYLASAEGQAARARMNGRDTLPEIIDG